MTTDDRFLFSVADKLVFEHGEFDPVEFLAAVGLLDERDRGARPSGTRIDLHSLLVCSVDEAIDALQRASSYLRKQGFDVRPRADHGSTAYLAGSATQLSELCAVCLRPSGAQTDLFRDSAVVLAQEAVCVALAAHDLAGASIALQRLQAAGDRSNVPDGYRALMDAVADQGVSPVERLEELETKIVPLAYKHLRMHARAYLVSLWHRLAKRLDGVPFSVGSPACHSSYAYLHAECWTEALAASTAEQGWEREPVLMARAAEAHSRLGNRAQARCLWTRMCWVRPDAAAQLLAGMCGDPILARRWHEFCDLDPELPIEDFPAWLLMADLRQREFVPLDLAQENAAGAYAAMYRLVQNHGDVSARQAVSHHNKDLLLHYFERRKLA